MTVRSMLLLGCVLAGCGGSAQLDGGEAGGGRGGGPAGGGVTGGGVATGGGGAAGGGSASGGGSAAGGGGGLDGGGVDCATQAFTEVSIPMRDGKSLAALQRAPVDPRCKLPVIVIQTPYGRAATTATWFRSGKPAALFDRTDYAFVIVDWRGYFGSTAARVPGLQQPYAEDGYDTVEWAGIQPYSNGDVGTWGVSALCVQQFKTASLKPPSLRAAVPIFCEQNTSYGQYYPGGVLRREYFDFTNGYFGAGLVLSLPYETAPWAVAGGQLKPVDVEVPMLIVSGWYDLMPARSVDTFRALAASASPAAGKHRLLIGPWIHFATGGESSMGRMLTAQEKQFLDVEERIQQDSVDFFALHLKREVASPAALWAKVRFAQAPSTVVDQSAPEWPPTSAVALTLQLTSSGALGAADGGTVAFPYDPADPSPTVGGGTLSGTLAHGPALQTPVLARGDAKAFVGELLTAPLRTGGVVDVQLEVATTGADTDLAVRLTDVQPDGGQLLVGEGIRRLKLRNGFAAPQLVAPGTRVPVQVPLTADVAYTWDTGHRVGLIVSGSNFPRFDRNPNTGANFAPDAGSPVQAVTTTVFTDGTSRLVLHLR